MAEFVEVLKQRKRMCVYSENNCIQCKLSSHNNEYRETCSELIIKYPQEAEQIIMDWAKEHPLMTNADKFKEVFGFDIRSFDCPKQCKDRLCSNCDEDFWRQERKEPKGCE